MGITGSFAPLPMTDHVELGFPAGRHIRRGGALWQAVDQAPASGRRPDLLAVACQKPTGKRQLDNPAWMDCVGDLRRTPGFALAFLAGFFLEALPPPLGVA